MTHFHTAWYQPWYTTWCSIWIGLACSDWVMSSVCTVNVPSALCSAHSRSYGHCTCLVHASRQQHCQIFHWIYMGSQFIKIALLSVPKWERLQALGMNRKRIILQIIQLLMHILGLKRCLLLGSALYTCTVSLDVDLSDLFASKQHSSQLERLSMAILYIHTCYVVIRVLHVVILCLLVLGLWKNLEPLGSFPKLAALHRSLSCPCRSCFISQHSHVLKAICDQYRRLVEVYYIYIYIY